MKKIFINNGFVLKDKNDISFNECYFMGSNSKVSNITTLNNPKRDYNQRWAFRVKKISDVDKFENVVKSLLRQSSKEVFYPKNNKDYFIQDFTIGVEPKEEGYYSEITLQIKEI